MKVYGLCFIIEQFSVLDLLYVPKSMPSVTSFCFKPFEENLQIYVVFIIMDLDTLLGVIRGGVAGGEIRIQNFMRGDNFAHSNGCHCCFYTLVVREQFVLRDEYTRRKYRWSLGHAKGGHHSSHQISP